MAKIAVKNGSWMSYRDAQEKRIAVFLKKFADKNDVLYAKNEMFINMGHSKA